MNDYYNILGISKNSSITDIKNKYKKIAIECHPDKLHNILDPNIKNDKIEFFKKATEAYKFLTNNYYNDFNDFNDFSFLNTIFNYINKFKTKNIKHHFNLDVSYFEVFNNTKRKIRILLNNVNEPIFIIMHCSKFPQLIINHIDDDCNDHEITINMILISNNTNYTHIINNDKTIDLFYDIICSLKEFICGFSKDIIFIDNNILNINIKPFTLKYIIDKYGINNGNLIINIKPDLLDINDNDKLLFSNFLNV